MRKNQKFSAQDAAKNGAKAADTEANAETAPPDYAALAQSCLGLWQEHYQSIMAAATGGAAGAPAGGAAGFYGGLPDAVSIFLGEAHAAAAKLKPEAADNAALAAAYAEQQRLLVALAERLDALTQRIAQLEAGGTNTANTDKPAGRAGRSAPKASGGLGKKKSKSAEPARPAKLSRPAGTARSGRKRAG